MTAQKRTQSRSPRRGPNRTREQIQRDRAFIAGLYVKNYELHEMAERLQEYCLEEGDDYILTPQQIWYDCKQIMIEWKKTRIEAIDDYINVELKKLDKIENELWVAWEKSKGGRRKTKIDGGTMQAGAVTGGTLKERSLEDTNGEARYLSLIMEVMDRRAKLLGYNAPIKVQLQQPANDEDKQATKTLEQLPESLLMQMSDAMMGIKRINPALN